MRLPEEDFQADYKTEPPISYLAYRGLGWLFVFSIYILTFAWGFIFIGGFRWKLGQIFTAIAIWEVCGIITFLRWGLPLGPSGVLIYFYELIFPWKYRKPKGED
ncbi:hypothetical protein ACFL54_02730 [Planctomycetota bacterium]